SAASRPPAWATKAATAPWTSTPSKKPSTSPSATSTPPASAPPDTTPTTPTSPPRTSKLERARLAAAVAWTAEHAPASRCGEPPRAERPAPFGLCVRVRVGAAPPAPTASGTALTLTPSDRVLLIGPPGVLRPTPGRRAPRVHNGHPASVRRGHAWGGGFPAARRRSTPVQTCTPATSFPSSTATVP